MERYRDLVEYKEQFGDCAVPQRYEPNIALGNWVCTQRKRYKKYIDGKRPPMRDERIKLLDAIGFQWCARAPMIVWPTQKKAQHRETTTIGTTTLMKGTSKSDVKSSSTPKQAVAHRETTTSGTTILTKGTSKSDVNCSSDCKKPKPCTLEGEYRSRYWKRRPVDPDALAYLRNAYRILDEAQAANRAKGRHLAGKLPPEIADMVESSFIEPKDHGPDRKKMKVEDTSQEVHIERKSTKWGQHKVVASVEQSKSAKEMPPHVIPKGVTKRPSNKWVSEDMFILTLSSVFIVVSSPCNS